MSELERKIADAIFEAIANSDDNEGRFDAELEDNDSVITVAGEFEINGYCENDYNGTGAWVTTSASVIIDDVRAYDDDGESVELLCNIRDIEKYIEREIA